MIYSNHGTQSSFQKLITVRWNATAQSVGRETGLCDPIWYCAV